MSRLPLFLGLGKLCIEMAAQLIIGHAPRIIGRFLKLSADGVQSLLAFAAPVLP